LGINVDQPAAAAATTTAKRQQRKKRMQLQIHSVIYAISYSGRSERMKEIHIKRPAAFDQAKSDSIIKPAAAATTSAAAGEVECANVIS